MDQARVASPRGECSLTGRFPTGSGWKERGMFNQNFSSGGFEGSSPRDARFRQFIALGPGWKGFVMKPDLEEDGDAAAQFLAGADMARVEEVDVRLNHANDFALVDSLEALMKLGVEIADPRTIEDIEGEDDDMIGVLYAEGFEMSSDDEDNEDWPEEEEFPRAGANVFRDGAFLTETASRDYRGAGRAYQDMVIAPKLQAFRMISQAIVAAEKCQGKPITPPPVGKYLMGTVVSQGHKGLLVDIGDGMEARIPIALEHGHGSWAAAADWLYSFRPGTEVRIKVIQVRVNGHVEIVAVIADHHLRPWQQSRRPNEQTAELAPAAK